MSHGLTATDSNILSQTGCRRNSFPSGQNFNSLLVLWSEQVAKITRKRVSR